MKSFFVYTLSTVPVFFLTWVFLASALYFLQNFNVNYQKKLVGCDSAQYLSWFSILIGLCDGFTLVSVF